MRREIGPQLESVHASHVIRFGHFLMYYPAPSGHPLHFSFVDRTMIPHAVTMLSRTFQHVGDSFYTPVRMPWETWKILIWIVITKIIQHQKGIIIGQLMITECPFQMHTSTFQHGFSFADTLYLARHNVLLFVFFPVDKM
ncbi:hypothetical protein DSECCO2_643430 [anaerobic digester metagenome]